MLRQSFLRKNNDIIRSLEIGGIAIETTVSDLASAELEPAAAWWQTLLRGEHPYTDHKVAPIRIVDAFCGPGGLALGVRSAIEACGGVAEFTAIIDTDVSALGIHRHNLGAHCALSASVAGMVDFHVLGVGDKAAFGYAPEVVHPGLMNVGDVDMFIAGPPCQGHSNLNNHTRRQDPRNDLYVAAVALGIALQAEMIIIENVPTVQNSQSDVVVTAAGLLKSSGYGVAMGILRADELGAAQRRTRHFMIAVAGKSLAPDYLLDVARKLASPAMPLSWAIDDLLEINSNKLVDTAPTSTPVNAARIDYLFDHDLYDLPDAQRPDCHKNGTTYTSVYGRMHWDRPAQTITTGIGTPGQGRFIHPLLRRVVTPHEAARIQGFPDWFKFDPEGTPVKRKNLAKWIGDAVHPILGYAAGLAVLSARREALGMDAKKAA